MTIQEAIAQTDALVNNEYEGAVKVKWLSDLDGYVQKEIIDTHYCGGEYFGYTVETPLDTVLLVPEPYSDIYRFYLEMQIYLANGEMIKYDNAKTLYDNKFLTYADYYNRTHKPRKLSRMVF